MTDLSVERHLLLRCERYSNESEQSLNKMLETRYSLKGTQKNYLLLGATQSAYQIGKPVKLKKKQERFQLAESGVDAPKIPPRVVENKYSKWRTRNEFKEFIRSNLKLQRRGCSRLRKQKGDMNALDTKLFGKLLTIEDFAVMNRLWQEYVLEFIGNDRSATPASICPKLATAEFVGAYVEVEYSKCLPNVGQRGVVIWESQFNFIVATGRGPENGWKGLVDSVDSPDFSVREKVGGIRVISKKNTRFLIRVPVPNDPESEYRFVLNGNRIQYRGYERANRKMKNHAVNDLI